MNVSKAPKQAQRGYFIRQGSEYAFLSLQAKLIESGSLEYLTAKYGLTYEVSRTVSESALRRRLARKLAHDDCAIHKSREGSRVYYERGPYYILNARYNICVDSGHLEVLAEEYGVLREGEHLLD